MQDARKHVERGAVKVAARNRLDILLLRKTGKKVEKFALENQLPELSNIGPGGCVEGADRGIPSFHESSVIMRQFSPD